MSSDDATGPVPAPAGQTGQPGQAGADMAEELRQMWARLDPVPVGLVDRVAFALELDELSTADLDLELLRLTEQQVGAGTGTRGGDDVRSVTFSSETTTVMLAIDGNEGGHRVDGWVAPGGRRLIEVRTSSGTTQEHCDHTGRFTLARVPSGHLQLVVSRVDDDTGRAFVTPALTL